VFKNRVLRGIYWPNCYKETGDWRTLQNDKSAHQNFSGDKNR
jgi:hypothetical protein